MYGRNRNFNMGNGYQTQMPAQNQQGYGPADPNNPMAQTQLLQNQLAQMQAQLNQLRNGQNPYLQQVPQNNPQQFIQQPQQPDAATSVNHLPQETQMILALFDEFSETEDGKQLVAFIGKFNGFCQSKVAKGSKKPQT